MPRTKTSESPSTGEAFAALQIALRESDPACLGDPRFTQDTSDPTPLKLVCAGCPILPQCRTLALTNPQGRVFGVLGGRVCRAEPKPRRGTA